MTNVHSGFDPLSEVDPARAPIATGAQAIVRAALAYVAAHRALHTAVGNTRINDADFQALCNADMFARGALYAAVDAAPEAP